MAEAHTSDHPGERNVPWHRKTSELEPKKYDKTTFVWKYEYEGFTDNMKRLIMKTKDIFFSLS